MGTEQGKKIILIIHNVRSAHNVGSMFRTADGAGVDEIILSGYTPVPPKEGALYLTDADKALRKTALGAEASVPWKKVVSLTRLLNRLKKEGYEIAALEQHGESIDYQKYHQAGDVVLIVGNEVTGIEGTILKQCDRILELPMRGKKNSLNVAVAAGIALYQIIGTMKEKKNAL